ncbi:MAG TPA: hypothetical protein VFN61_12375 [Acidimicrobiales bacterium]|nr:hypothetical protein [Acidimicrobiales bacterium]
MDLRFVYPAVVLVTSLAVGIDASRLGAKRGTLGGGFLDMGPEAWFFCCLFIWVISFPCYLVVRGRLQSAHRLGMLAGVPPAGAPAPFAPPPGELWPGVHPDWTPSVTDGGRP